MPKPLPFDVLSPSVRAQWEPQAALLDPKALAVLEQDVMHRSRLQHAFATDVHLAPIAKPMGNGRMCWIKASDLQTLPEQNHSYQVGAMALQQTPAPAHASDGGVLGGLGDTDDRAEVLDTLCQIAGKGWCTPLDAGYLLQAIDAILDPQAHLCSFGAERGPLETATSKGQTQERPRWHHYHNDKEHTV